VPPEVRLQIVDARLQLHLPGTGRFNPPRDRLSRRAAEAFGKRAGVVLVRGAGSDGAAGARQVRASGSIVIIQASLPRAPQKCLRSRRPRSIASRPQAVLVLCSSGVSRTEEPNTPEEHKTSSRFWRAGVPGARPVYRRDAYRASGAKPGADCAVDQGSPRRCSLPPLSPRDNKEVTP
jgi:hypothetical protein